MDPGTSKGLHCFVPTCSNNEQTTPDKVFVRIRDQLKHEWCVQVNVKYKKTTVMYCCEDHLNLEEDLENYHKWKLMNEKPFMKTSARVRYHSNTDKENIENERDSNCEMVGKAPMLAKLLLQSETSESIKRKYDESFPSTSTSTQSMHVDCSTQCKVKMVDKETNYKARKILPSREPVIPMPEQESSEELRSSPSLFGLTPTSSMATECEQVKDCLVREQTLKLINKKPKMYLGIPLEYMWIINYILLKSHAKTTALNLILTLFKIKQNDSLERIGDQFQMTKQNVSKIIPVGIQVLANFLQNFIYMPTKMQIKRNLPPVFKINHSKVQMIIDCFEIQIEKPSDPIKQAQTWSQYKSCNTVKYLVGATPNGFISFISEGYGGRTSDKAMVEKTNLIAVLPPNAVVMADRGFKEVEVLLSSKNIKMLRPPSVYSGTKPTKEQVLQTKVIASLRIHIERVIRRIREYKMLKPHSVVNHSLVGCLDEILIIACGLINLQGEIIK